MSVLTWSPRGRVRSWAMESTLLGPTGLTLTYRERAGEEVGLISHLRRHNPILHWRPFLGRVKNTYTFSSARGGMSMARYSLREQRGELERERKVDKEGRTDNGENEEMENQGAINILGFKRIFTMANHFHYNQTFLSMIYDLAALAIHSLHWHLANPPSHSLSSITAQKLITHWKVWYWIQEIKQSGSQCHLHLYVRSMTF